MKFRATVLMSLVLFPPALSAAQANGTTIETRSLTYRTRVRATAFAEKAEVISCPLHHPQIKYIAADGSRVKKGDLITEFDADDAMRRLQDQELERDIIQADLDRNLTSIRNKTLALRDDLDALRDRKAVLTTKLARFRSMPDEDEVRVATGRLRVAELEWVAASNDLQKADGRFERAMISRAELDKYAFGDRRERARLRYAMDSLDYVSLPASSNTIRKLALEIENVQMEIGKVEHEIEENAELSEIRRKGALARKEIVETRIKELSDDVKNLKLYAPIAGYVVHLREFRNWFLKSGQKMFKDFSFINIPDPRTVAFKAVLSQSARKYFEVGDTALLRVVGGRDNGEDGARPEPLRGKISSISRLARDLGEKEEARWGERDESGILVYDIVLTPETRPGWLRIGAHAECELVSSKTIAGPCVSASYARTRNGDYYLSFGGEFRKVDGELLGGYLLLADPQLAGREVSLRGKFADTRKTGTDESGNARFQASGELAPVDTADVRVGRILHWQKVAWLVEEDSDVKEGDVVARLEAKDTLEEVRRWQSRLKEAESSRRSAEEELELKEHDGRFKLSRERNLLEIARLEYNTTFEGRDWTAIFAAERDLRLAEIRLEEIGRRLERAEKSPTMLAPSELERLRRDRKRQTLLLERTEIRLAELRRGPTPVQRSDAELKYLEQELKLDTLQKRVETDTFRASRQLARSRRHEAHIKRRLSDRNEWQENLVIKAPRDGIVRYTKIWNSGVFSKVNVGNSVGHRFRLMEIANVSEMYVRLEVPEKYYALIDPAMAVRVSIPSLTDETFTGTVSKIEFLFENKRKKDTQVGLYSSHENLGETVFLAHVQVPGQKGIKLKPGATAEVRFPFEK